MESAHFTLEEAQALIPKIAPVMGEVRELKRRVDAKVLTWKLMPSDDPVEKVMAQGHVDFLLREINERLTQIMSWGVQPKDLDMGLVDFPTQLEPYGEAVYCWRLGEADISFWHGPHEGFQGRKALGAPIRSYNAPF